MTLSRASIGLAVRVARDVSGLTLEALSVSTGLTLSTLSRTERGERDLAFVELLKLLEVCRVTLASFLALAESFETEGVADKTRSRDSLSADLTALQRQALQAIKGDL